MTRSFARKLAPEVKVNAIAPALIIFNAGDDEAYRQQALAKSLMKVAPGESEVVNGELPAGEPLRDRPHPRRRWRAAAALTQRSAWRILAGRAMLKSAFLIKTRAYA